MKVQNINFYGLYKKIVYLENNKFKNLSQNFINSGICKINKFCSGLLAYGYIDYECGMTFEILAQAQKNILGKINIYNDLSDVSLKFRIESVFDSDVHILNKNNYLQFANKINFIDENYKVNDDLEKTRLVRKIDHLRYNQNPDDVAVLFVTETNKIEQIWVRLTKMECSTRFYGTILNEPQQNFGVHIGDIVDFSLVDIDGEIVFVTDCKQY